MLTVGERIAAREQRNAERRVAVEEENAQRRALEMEDRIRALEAQNAGLVSHVEAMGDVIARQDAIRKQNEELRTEGFNLSEKYTTPHNRAARSRIMSYVQGLQRFEISSEDLSKMVYNHFDNERAKQRLTPARAAVRKTTNRRNGRRHMKCKRRRTAFGRHQAELEPCFSGGEALLQSKYMSDEETDAEYSGEVGKRVVVK
ncbi:hypothetical protein INT45_003506, partial [Circinella minor]